jgi:hypothetical protein
MDARLWALAVHLAASRVPCPSDESRPWA